MTHDRTTIRQAAKSALEADAAIVASRAKVYAGRIGAIPQAMVPAINVLTPSETVRDDSQESAPWRLERELSLVVEVTVWDKDERVADTLDTLAWLVECALLRDDTLGGACGELHLQSTETTFDVEGNVPMGTASVTFTALYDTTFPAEGTDPLPIFDEAHTAWDIVGNESSSDRARDTIAGLHE